MNTLSKTSKDSKRIFSIEDKLQFEKEILHFAFIHHVQNNMKGIKSNRLAKQLGVSNSFVSQLFSGDKIASLEMLAKFQRVLHFKFDIQVLHHSKQLEVANDGKGVRMLFDTHQSTQPAQFEVRNQA